MYTRRYAPLYLALIPALIVALALVLVFAIVAHDQGLPLWSEVPVTFIAGSAVLTWLVGLVTFAYDI